MATFKEALTTSLTNFAKSIAKTYPKTANIVDNLLSTDATLPLSANQGNVLKGQIDTLNSNLNKRPVNKTVIEQNVSISGTQSDTTQLDGGTYLIMQAHPQGISSLYLVRCMSNYTNTVTPIIEDSCCEMSIDSSCNLTISLQKGNGNFRWWHIIKMAGLNGLAV